MTDERLERRLAAVLVADVAGYSRLVGRDEERTLEQFKSFRKTLVNPTIAKHRGRIVKNTGDGMLAEFASAVDATRCAIEIQRAMAGQNAEVPNDARIEFRIGIHVGDIIIDDNDIFGDGVNIATRLEGIAEPGGVCISDDAQRQVRGKVDIAFDDMGPQTLKNIAEPMRTWRLQIGARAASPPPKPAVEVAQPPPPLSDKPSIAVLPFQNMSGDPEQGYFADGVVEDIITALSRVRSFFVIARNSSFTFRGKSIDVRKVGRDLGVRYVLEGSIRKAGTRLRITGQLVEAATGNHIWAERFDGELADVFDLQDRITEAVVSAIEPSLRLAEIERARNKPTENLDAYDLYLRALHDYYIFSRESFQRAIELTDRALKIDPRFGMAASLGSIVRSYGSAQGWLSASEYLEMRRLGDLALTLEPDNAETLAWVGRMIAWAEHDFTRAREMADKAISIDPNSALAWGQRGWTYHYANDPEEAIRRFQRAIRLSPRDRMLWSTLIGKALAEARLERYTDAIDTADKARIQNPGFSTIFRCLASCYANLGRVNEAGAAARQVMILEPGFSVSDWFKRSGTGWNEKMVGGLRAAGLPE